MAGKNLRMSRLFPDDDRILIVPNETLWPDRRWKDITNAVIKGGADAVIVTPGILKANYEVVAGKVPVILTVPLDPSYVDLAVQMDAAAVKWHYFGPLEDLPWWDVQRFASRCDDMGMPFLYEPVPRDKPTSEGGKNISDPNVILNAALRAVNKGVDIVKCNYSGTPKSFRKVTSRCPAPVVVLGGPLVPDRQCLNWIKGSIEGGAVGGALGRNTTQHKTPEKIVRAIRRIIHDDASVEEALKELE